MKLLSVVMLAFVVASHAAAADPTGRVEAKLTTGGDLWVGQRVPLTIKIQAPGFSIDGIAAFDIPEISGLIVLKLAGSPAIGNETIEEVTYVTQQHEFALFPQRAGEFTIPAFSVRFSSSAGYGKPVTPFVVQTEPLMFTAKLPPGAEKLRTLISTNHLTFEETWSPDVTSVKVGDAITRTITMKADDIPGMEFPPLSFNPIEGVGIYPKPPSVNDTSERGALAGQRVESVTYVFEKSGTCSLPGFSLAWWKLDEKTLKRETVDGRTISATGPVKTSETTGPGTASDPRRSSWSRIAGMAAVLGIVATVVAFLLCRKPVHVNEEAVLFSALESACRTNDRRRILAALTVWLDHTSSAPVILKQWVIQSGDKELAEQFEQLETDLYRQPASGSGSPFSGHALLVRLRKVRHRQTHPPDAETDQTVLAPLNPMSGNTFPPC